MGVCGVALLGLMALLILPSFTRPNRYGPRHEKTSGGNNLKQVGLSFRLWANDHEDRFPFASTNVDGSLAWVNSPEVFRHYQVMSNELVTPKILTCRADPARRPATNFADFSNANLSYFVAFEAMIRRKPLLNVPPVRLRSPLKSRCGFDSSASSAMK